MIGGVFPVIGIRRKGRYRIPVKQAMLAGTVGLILLTVISIAATSYLFANRVLISHARNIMENVALATVLHSENYLRPARDVAEVTRRLADEAFFDYANPSVMENYFFEQLRPHKQVSGIYFGAADGGFIHVSRNESRMKGGFLAKLILPLSGRRQVELKWFDSKGILQDRDIMPEDQYDPRQRPWYKQATLEQRLIWTDPYIFFTSRKPGITTASPVIDSKGNVLGVFGVDIEIDQISEFLRQLRIGQNGKAFVMERDGQLIAFPDIGKLFQTGDAGQERRFSRITEVGDPISRAAYESVKEQINNLDVIGDLFGRFTVGNNHYLTIFKQFKGVNKPWVIGLWVPEEDYLGELNDGMRIAAFAAFLITIFAIFLALVFARSITNPIKWISDSAVLLGEQSYDQREKKHSLFRELDDSLLKFNEMRAKIRQADDRTRELQDKLIQSTSVKTAFIANVSHELRTPMNAIIGFSDLLERQQFGKLNKKQEDFLNEIRSAGYHLNDMISNLIEISKIEGGEISLENQPVDLDQVVSDALMILHDVADKKNIKIEKNLQFLPEIRVDKRVCRQIFLNLLDNAVRFSPEGGVITISAQIKETMLHLDICDQGPGMPADQYDYVFEPFVQLSPMDDMAHKAIHEGTLHKSTPHKSTPHKSNKSTPHKSIGIGLTIAQALARLMGGKIQLLSNSGAGIIARFILPVTIPADR